MVLTVQEHQVVIIDQWHPQLMGPVALGLWMIYYETSNPQQSEVSLFSSVGALGTTGGKMKIISGIRY